MRYLLALLLLCSRLIAANGDLTASVETNGWVLAVYIDGAATNGTFNFGWDTYNRPNSSCPVVLTVNTLGYNSSATSNRESMTVYGTKQLRQPYPNNTLNDCVTNAGVGCIARIALSDYIYPEDVVTAVFLTNWYKANITNKTCSITVTNGSTVSHPKVVGNWTRPPLEHVQDGYITAAFFAVGPSPRNGMPVAAVEFWAVDEHGVSTPTNRVNNVIIDSTYGDAVPVQEYKSRILCTNLTNGDLATVHARIYPWRGTNVLDTSLTGNAYNTVTCELRPSVALIDNNLSYSNSIAVVDPNNSGTGVVVQKGAFNAGSPPVAFATIGAALTAMCKSNYLWYGRSDVGGGTIYLQPTNYVWTGATTTITNVNKTWCVIEPFPGVSRDQVVIKSQANAFNAGTATCWRNVTVTNASAVALDNLFWCWLDQCTFTNVTGSRTVDTCTNVYVTRCTITELPQGLRTPANPWSDWLLIRGNTIINTNSMEFALTTVLGNLRYGFTNTELKGVSDATSSRRSPWSYPVIAFNRLMQQRCETSASIQAFDAAWVTKNTNGVAIVGNVIEHVMNAANGFRVVSIGASVQTTPDSNDLSNVYIWQNTLLGNRCNFGENAGGDSAGEYLSPNRFHWSLINNSMDNPNTKTDINYNPSELRLGNWNVYYGVGWYGNTDLQPENMDSSSAWAFGFIGLNSYGATGVIGTNAFQSYVKYINAQRGVGDGGDRPGNGDYRLNNSSPLLLFGDRKVVLPFDITGNARGAFDPPGAYSSASPRKGTAFGF